MGREGHCKQIPLACMGSVCSGWTTLGLPQPKGLHCSVFSVLCKGTVPRASCILCTSQSKPLRFLGALQGHTPRWAVLFVPFPGLSSSGDWVLGELTDPDGPCILMTSPVWDAISQVCCESTVLGVHVSPLGG